MSVMQLKDIKYWPNPYPRYYGGYWHYDFTVVFEAGNIPENFTYTLTLTRNTGQIVKTFQDTVPTNGLQEVEVNIVWNGMVEMSPEAPAPYGGYAPDLTVTTSGYETKEESFCSGVIIEPPPQEPPPPTEIPEDQQDPCVSPINNF